MRSTGLIYPKETMAFQMREVKVRAFREILMIFSALKTF